MPGVLCSARVFDRLLPAACAAAQTDSIGALGRADASGASA